MGVQNRFHIWPPQIVEPYLDAVIMSALIKVTFDFDVICKMCTDLLIVVFNKIVILTFATNINKLLSVSAMFFVIIVFVTFVSIKS